MATVLRLPKIIKRVTVLQPEGGGSTLTVYRAKEKRKKQSRGLRGAEKLARRNAEAYEAFARTYLERHSRSNRKRRDGWLRDLGVNLFRANRKGSKKLKLARLLTSW